MTAEADALHSEVERGPVKLSVDITPKEPRLSDEPTLTLTISAADGIDVNAPPFGEAVGDFIIRDFYEPVPVTDNGRQILQQIYTLEPTRAGAITIDPITVRFTDSRRGGDGQPHEIQTEAIRLQIATMIDAEAPSLTDLRPAAPPVDVGRESGMAVLWLLAGGVLGLLLIVFLLSRLRNRKTPAEPQLTPQQLARRELDELIASRLSQTDVKQFFVELTGVVRRYIERSTGVRAPEQTTEEFLREMNGQSLFSDEENRRLAAFLESADLVKFAGFQPEPEAITQSTQLARQFIELQSDLADRVAVDETGAAPTAEPSEVEHTGRERPVEVVE
ncbi:MAG: hypothetical protein RIK87_18650 [Fuerstiella sp.]